MVRSVLAPLLALALCCTTSLVASQRTTYLDDQGYTVVASVQTDAEGDPTDTTTLIHITTGVAQADATTTAATTAATTTANQAVVAQPPQTTCTTAGCPVDPTTTIGGAVSSVIVTWTATTPTTPIPTWTSSGKVLSAAQYMTTTVTASGLSRISASSAASPLLTPLPLGLERWMGVGLAVLVAGLGGAVVVL